MIIKSFINNVSFLVSLLLIYYLVYRKCHRKIVHSHLNFQITTGVLFGLITSLGMLNPFTFSSGIIFDGRSILLSLAPLFCGPLGSLISLLITILARTYLGGTGLFIGILVSTTSVLSGIIYLKLSQKYTSIKSNIGIYIFSLIVHSLVLLEFLLLPIQVINTVSIPILLIYPLATLLIYTLIETIIEAINNEKSLVSILKDKDILIEEVYHRTKNNMQVIIGMLSLRRIKSDNDVLKDEFRRIESKIYSLSLAHQMISESNDLSNIKLDKYIKELIFSFDNDYENKNIIFSFNIPCIYITIDAISPIGLIFTELVSNSYTHGYKNNGKVYITIEILNKDKLKILYEEIDNYKDTTNMQLGLGLETVKRICEIQLLGSFKLNNKENFSIEMQINQLNHKKRL